MSLFMKSGVAVPFDEFVAFGALDIFTHYFADPFVEADFRCRRKFHKLPDS